LDLVIFLEWVVDVLDWDLEVFGRFEDEFIFDYILYLI
jgi:hypothetical protein